jgi:chloramphenicol-sensitive protein RarD
VNWLVYIWAVTHGKVLEASLGYYINPLVNVALGVAVLGERLRPRQLVAIGIAAVGVAVLVLRVGTVPWVALTLAGSFGVYGLVRKRGQIDPLAGLFVETALVAPLSVGLLVARAVDGTGAFGRLPGTSILLLAAGFVTAAPLIWFAHGVRRLRLSTMGVVQYLAPTLQFLCAVVAFHEPFDAAHAAVFACIWGSLALYTLDAVSVMRAG